MIEITKTITTDAGIAVGFHRVARVEFSKDGSAVLVFGQSWGSQEQALAGVKPLHNWARRIESTDQVAVGALLEAIKTTLLTDGDLADGVVLEQPAGQDLPSLKRAKRLEIYGAWKQELTGGLTVGGASVPTDAAAMVDYLTLKAAAGDGAWVDWPILLSDGTVRQLTQAQAAALWSALKNQRITLTNKLKSKAEQIAAATTAAEVEAVTWK